MCDTQLNDESVQRLRDGGGEELAVQFQDAEDVLLKMIELRLSALRRRLDAADVVQDTFIEANRRLPEYLADPAVQPVVWFRKLARQMLARLYRTHFGTQARDLGRELGLPGIQAMDSESMALDMTASMDSPYSQAARKEERLELQRLLTQMPTFDKEVLCLKLVEGLSFAEVSTELNITTSAAKRAYHRATTQLNSMNSFLNQHSVS